jgi:hyperosmotically inducible protein
MRAWKIACVATVIAGCAESPPPRTAASTETATETRTETTVQRASEPERAYDVHPSDARAEAEPVAAVAPAVAPAGTNSAGEGTRYPMKTMNAEGAIAAPAASNPPRADNTAVNKRDTNDANLTPMDQGSSTADRNMTADIRKAVVADGSLSFTAKNVKIITRDGNVVLRGPVKTEAEKASIQAAATRVAGAGRVNNQLEIAK